MKRTVDIFNQIRALQSEEFKERIPEGTLKNFGDIDNPLKEYTVHMNEFVDTLVNKVAFTLINTKRADNPLKYFKKGSKPLGVDIEEIHTEMAKAHEFNKEGDTLLKRKDSESYVVYHRLNTQKSYSVGWSRMELKRGFGSWDGLRKFINDIVQTLYSGAYHDEFLMTKQLMVDGVESGKIITTEVVEPVDKDTAKDFAKQIRLHSSRMTFMTQAYNTYEKKDGKPVYTRTPRDRQVLVLNLKAVVEMDVELLAYAFNMSKTDFSKVGKVIEVDNFNDNEDIIGILMDESLLQIYDDTFELAPQFFNPENMYIKHYLHVAQTFSLSPFSNAIAFKKKATVETE